MNDIFYSQEPGGDVPYDAEPGGFGPLGLVRVIASTIKSLLKKKAH